MMQRNINQQLLDEAAEWAVLIDDGDLAGEEKTEFAHWLRESPRHLEEFLAAAAILFDCEKLDKKMDVEKLLHEAQSGSVTSIDTNVSRVSSESKQAVPPARKGVEKTENWFALSSVRSLAAALVVGLAITFFAWNSQPEAELYATAVGEQRSIQLEDNSTIFLNTKSKVAVSYRRNERQVELLMGEASFSVEKDDSKPFRVISGDTTVEALGTEFNVHRQAGKVIVALLHGKVSVDPSTEGKTDELILTPGQQVNVDQHGQASDIKTFDPETVNAWKERRLVFSQTPLNEVVSEFNRYNRTRLFLEEGELENYPISGVFNADEPQSLIDFLEVANAIEKPNEFIDASKLYLRKKR